MMSEKEMKELAWHSRRGMLELDLLLLPFVRDRVPDLNERLKSAYQQLLTQEDQDLFAWLMQRSEAPEQLREIVSLIVENSRLTDYTERTI